MAGVVHSDQVVSYSVIHADAPQKPAKTIKRWKTFCLSFPHSPGYKVTACITRQELRNTKCTSYQCRQCQKSLWVEPCMELHHTKEIMLTTSRITSRVTGALKNQARDWIVFPDQREADKQKMKFCEIRNMPNVFSCIDGTSNLIPIQAPREKRARVCVQEKLPCRECAVITFSDGCSAQYKSKLPFHYLQNMATDSRALLVLLWVTSWKESLWFSRWDRKICCKEGGLKLEMPLVIRNTANLHSFCQSKLQVDWGLLSQKEMVCPCDCVKEEAVPATMASYQSWKHWREQGLFIASTQLAKESRKLTCFCEPCLEVQIQWMQINGTCWHVDQTAKSHMYLIQPNSQGEKRNSQLETEIVSSTLNNFMSGWLASWHLSSFQHCQKRLSQRSTNFLWKWKWVKKLTIQDVQGELWHNSSCSVPRRWPLGSVSSESGNWWQLLSKSS